MRNRTWKFAGATVVILAAVVSVVLGLVMGVKWLDERYQRQAVEQGAKVVATEGDDLASRVQEACRSGGDAAQELAKTNACEQADRTRETIQDAPIEPNATAPSALPPLQTRYVPIPGPTGKTGATGRAGRDGQDSTVPGPAGADGADSTVPGPGASDDQVAAQVAAYCAARNDCTPPPAKDGAKGEPGADAPRIADIVCEGGLTPVTFTFVYSDGTTDTVTCGELEPIPTPTPEETP